MNKRYINAIAIGAILGLFALVCAAFEPYVDNFYSDPYRYVIGCVLFRFRELFLGQGQYFLFISVCLACGLAALEDLSASNFAGVAFRRALKLTGLILLGLFVVTLAPLSLLGFEFAQATLLFEILSAARNLIQFFCGGLLLVAFGPAEVLLLVTFVYHLDRAHKQAKEADSSQLCLTENDS